jgi:hypothetical protein
MRKLKLLMATLAMIVGLSQNARANVVPTASTPTTGNVYYLYNPATQKFLTAAGETGDGPAPYVADYGRPWIIEESDEDYYIKLRLNGDSEGFFWGKYWANFKGKYGDYPGEIPFRIDNVSDGTYKLHPYAWKDTENAFVYINTGNDNRVACNSNEQSNLDEKYTFWQFVTETDYANYLSEKYGTDIASSKVGNTTFDSNITGWSTTGEFQNKAIASNQGGAFIVPFFENWNGTAKANKMYKDITSISNGKYTLKMAAFVNNLDTENQYIFANSNKTYLTTTTPIYYEVSTLVTNNTLSIGLEQTTATANWMGIDNVHLYYNGNNISYYSPTAFTTGSSVTKDAWNRYEVSTAGVYKIESSEAVTITYAQDESKDADSETATLSIAASGYTTIALTSGYFYFKSDKTSTITMTSLIPDGTYYLKASSTWNSTSKSVTAACGKYLARGNASGTHATIDKYGLPIAITTTADNKSTLSPQDTKRFYYHTENWQCWADKGSVGDDAKFDITLHDGEYRIHNTSMTAGRYFKYNDDDVNNAIISVYDDGTGTNSGPIINWTLETPEDHATYLQGLKDAQAASVASSASATSDYKSLTGITSMSDLSDKLHSEFFNQTPIVPSSDITSTVEKFQGNQPDGSNTGEIVYNGSVDITEPGIYRFSMQAFYRSASNEVTQTMHENGIDFPPVILFFGNSETQIKSLYDETGHDAAVDGSNPADVLYNNKYYANSQASALKMFQDGKYFNDVYLYVASAGTYNYGVKYLGFANAISQWFCYTPQSVSITKYTEATSEEDRKELEDLFNAYPLGFEKDEYAPYENVEAIEAWKKAKGVLESGTELKWKIYDAINDLGGADWKQNLGEVNAFASGDFNIYQTINGEDFPNGWNLYNGDNNHSRIMGGSEGTSNAGLSASSSRKALLLKYNATYGETDGYTMPLKAGKIYKITFKHGRWNEANPRVTNVVMTDPEGNPITLAPGFQAADDGCQSDPTKWYDYTGYFVSTTAGDYKFNFEKALNGSGQNTQMQIGIADIDLRTAEDITFADGSVPTYAPGTYPTVKISRPLTAGRWATAVYPFAVSGVDNIAVLSSFNAGTGSIRFETATESAANEPFLMRSASDKSEITLNNIAVSATTETPIVTKNEASLIGAYNSTNITNAQANYVLSNNGIYDVGANGAIINPYRAYIQIAGGSGARSLVFFVDEETTAIEGLNSERATTVGNIYNLNGQLVRKNADNLNGLQKGIYIVGGKRITVK